MTVLLRACGKCYVRLRT